ncbi:protein PLASTID MOVEMENT IMPAIRED 1-like [Curcuma longa]|uniref:protein PLASTID MOVEMENT IMPAIRED 1-like n=1 Tax=Curcuma longa TaxID=136217 RepID=UPI003D9E5C0E
MADHDAEILRELETLNRSLSITLTSRRAASLVLPRSSNTTSASGGYADGPQIVGEASRYDLGSYSSRQESTSAWLELGPKTQNGVPGKGEEPIESSERRRGIWNWKPVRALAHLSMRRVVCLFSVEVVALRHLPDSANGLRLSVSVRKKETKDRSLQTMPARAAQGRAEFQETLFLQCHLYYTGGAGTGKPLRFEPRLFLISAIAVDAPHLDLGTAAVDLSSLVKESIQKNLEGHRVRQWDVAFPLSGKAAGGEMALKLAFQIMDDGGIGIYKQTEYSPKSNSGIARDLEASKGLIFDQKEDFDLPEFEVIDKGVEIAASENDNARSSSVSSEVVKEVVQDRAQRSRAKELHLIAKELKELEMLVMADAMETTKLTTQPPKPSRLDTEEELVTREFLKLLEIGNHKEPKYDEHNDLANLSPIGLVPDLGKNLGCIVQTSDGGYLASMNPLNAPASRTETPKLAMQISRELIVEDEKLTSGFEVFHRLASEELCSKLLSLVAMDDLVGKTAEQVAFEGIASAIITGRNKEGASSSAARSIAMAKKMATAMNKARKARTSLSEEADTLDEVLCIALQKIEAMAVEALKVQAEIADEEAPLEALPPADTLNLAVKHHDWCTNCSRATILLVIQLRDPVRGYEAVGAPLIATVQAVPSTDQGESLEERRFELESVHVGGLKLGSDSKIKSAWDGEKQRLTAMQWLVENGVGKAAGGRRARKQGKRSQDFVWSFSSRFMDGMWLKHVRNPNLITSS